MNKKILALLAIGIILSFIGGAVLGTIIATLKVQMPVNIGDAPTKGNGVLELLDPSGVNITSIVLGVFDAGQSFCFPGKTLGVPTQNYTIKNIGSTDVYLYFVVTCTDASLLQQMDFSIDITCSGANWHPLNVGIFYYNVPLSPGCASS